MKGQVKNDPNTLMGAGGGEMLVVQRQQPDELGGKKMFDLWG